MLNFCSLYSGSSGNSLLIKTENTNILIDAGVSSKKIELALNSLEIEPNKLDGILITHEHTDHVQGLGTFAKKFDLPVFVNNKTLDAMPKQKEKISEKNIHFIKNEEFFEIKDLKIKPFAIPHDAANPCGFSITKADKKISIATDIGHMTNGIIKNLEDSLFVLLESNYDPDVLMYSKYPYPLKTRIAGPTGHLSNEIAGKTIAHLLNSGLQRAMLGHLSKESNFPELAYKTVMEELLSNNLKNDSFQLSVAKREEPSPLISICN